MFDLPVRPEISLPAILGYSFLTFVIALALTGPFVGFLRKYRLGKQLRVEAVDGGSASVFLTYHKSKAGTPTMGGILIWISIFATVIVSRLLSFYGTVYWAASTTTSTSAAWARTKASVPGRSSRC